MMSFKQNPEEVPTLPVGSQEPLPQVKEEAPKEKEEQLIDGYFKTYQEFLVNLP